eukprot:2301209-Amphidinium_carterae.1
MASESVLTSQPNPKADTLSCVEKPLTHKLLPSQNQKKKGGDINNSVTWSWFLRFDGSAKLDSQACCDVLFVVD